MFTDSFRKDYTGRSLVFISANELNGLTLTGYCFSQEKLRSDVFPSDMRGVTFKYCNLTNCAIPEGNTVGEGCQVIPILCQSDGEDWYLDQDDKPICPVDVKLYLMMGRSIDPRDLP